MAPLEATPHPPLPFTSQAVTPQAVTPPRRAHRPHLFVEHNSAQRHSHRPAAAGKGAPHLFDHWDDISQRLRAAKRIELFLDFDGTLVEFRFGPDQVSLGGKSRAALTRLARHPLVGVAIVSGRRSAALRKFIKVPGVRFMGLYGWEGGVDASGRPRKHSFPPRTLQQLSTLRRTLKTLPVEIPGIRVEDKGLSLAIHFRGASATARKRAEKRMRAIGRQFRGDLQVLGANCVWDIVPRQVRGKGAAIREAMARVPAKTLPIFLGDDLTDEPAFAALRRGVTILVGPGRPTRARFRLGNPREVRVFLERLGGVLHAKS
jgi:trehalose 6-phosphate phosphatase